MAERPVTINYNNKRCFANEFLIKECRGTVMIQQVIRYELQRTPFPLTSSQTAFVICFTLRASCVDTSP